MECQDDPLVKNFAFLCTFAAALLCSMSAQGIPSSKEPGQWRITQLLLAQQEIRFAQNTLFQCINSKDPRRPGFPSDPFGKCASICCGGVIYNLGQNFGGTIYENDPASLEVEAQIYNPRRHYGSGTGGSTGLLGMGLTPHSEPVPAGTFPLAPPPLVPPTATSLANTPMLVAGDYRATNFKSRVVIGPNGGGKIRIFLYDGEDSPPVYELPQTVNIFYAPNFEIFYSGTRRIRFRGPGLCGVVYAPYATVEVGFNQTVTGAIVANRIVCEGNNTFQFNPMWTDQAM
jgi:hypothetical protein